MRYLCIIYVFVSGCCFINVQAFTTIRHQHIYNIQQHDMFRPTSAYAIVGNPVSIKITQTKRKSFEVVNEWKYLDFEYETYERRRSAIENR